MVKSHLLLLNPNPSPPSTVAAATQSPLLPPQIWSHALPPASPPCSPPPAVAGAVAPTSPLPPPRRRVSFGSTRWWPQRRWARCTRRTRRRWSAGPRRRSTTRNTRARQVSAAPSPPNPAARSCCRWRSR